MNTFKKAFTLIELLIVITIIGILAVAFLPSVTAGPSRARDVQRVSDLADVTVALELFYQDNGEYPISGTPPTGLSNIDASAGSDLVTYFNNGQIPSDPVSSRTMIFGGANTTGLYYYEDIDGGQGYVLVANVENKKVAPGYYDFATPPTDFTTPPTALATSTTTGDNTYYVIYKGQ